MARRRYYRPPKQHVSGFYSWPIFRLVNGVRARMAAHRVRIGLPQSMHSYHANLAAHRGAHRVWFDTIWVRTGVRIGGGLINQWQLADSNQHVSFVLPQILQLTRRRGIHVYIYIYVYVYVYIYIYVYIYTYMYTCAVAA